MTGRIPLPPRHDGPRRTADRNALLDRAVPAGTHGRADPLGGDASGQHSHHGAIMAHPACPGTRMAKPRDTATPHALRYGSPPTG